jgi:hypothetical protein
MTGWKRKWKLRRQPIDEANHFRGKEGKPRNEQKQQQQQQQSLPET